MKYYAILLSVMIGISFSLWSCKGKSDASAMEENDAYINIDSTENIQKSIADLKSDEMIFLVEGAVDSWFFYHLHDYRSYEPIIRSTEYEEAENCYIHKCRYRASTLGGGYSTEEKIFKVTFDIDSKDLKDFKVIDLTGKRNLTEK